MPLTRTRTFGAQDVVVTKTIPSVTVAGQYFIVSPIAGFVERVLIVRGGSHSATEILSFQFDGGGFVQHTMTSGGAARDVDVFERVAFKRISAGGLISFSNLGIPVETTPISVAIVIRRQ